MINAAGSGYKTTFVCVLWRQRWCEIMNYGYVNSDFIGMKLGPRTLSIIEPYNGKNALPREIFLQKE